MGGFPGGGGSSVIGKQKYGLHGAPVQVINQGNQGGSSILVGGGKPGRSGGGPGIGGRGG